jgi:hypothetical protein
VLVKLLNFGEWIVIGVGCLTRTIWDRFEFSDPGSVVDTLEVGVGKGGESMIY